ncbi:MAG: hypothetical protein QM756_31430 [Polyangiaceae bacterium]
MRMTPRWIVLATLAGALGVATARPSYACGNSAWRLSSNSLSCLSISPTVPPGNFAVLLTNSCTAALHIANRNTTATGTRALDLEAGAKGVELQLPAPAKGGEAAVFDCTASTQSGELRFTFTADDDCAACNVTRVGQPPSKAGWLGCAALAGVAAVVVRRRRRA